MYGFCRRICQNAEDAGDLTQETFLLACRHFDQLRGDHPEKWLFTIAIRRWRREKSRRQVPTVPLEEALEKADREVLTGTVDRLAYEEALAVLSPGQREAFLLVVEAGFTHREAASLLGKRLGTVQYAVFWACRRLRSVLAEEEVFSQADPGRSSSAGEAVRGPSGKKLVDTPKHRQGMPRVDP